MSDDNDSSTSVTITPVPTGKLPTLSSSTSTSILTNTDSPVTITPVFTAVTIPPGLGSMSTSTMSSGYSSPVTTSATRVTIFDGSGSGTERKKDSSMDTVANDHGSSGGGGGGGGSENNINNNYDPSKDANSNILVLTKQRLQELVNEIDPREQLDEEVEDLLLNIADDFIDNVVTNACKLAKHRGAKTLEVKDVQLILEKEWNLFVPGFGPLALTNEFKQLYKKSPATEAHKQRLALIKKTLKKF
ncbi:uncharacterized protein LOC141854668 [Brevipalpus obovatus]|uniref:uncharacterized protein LOC141854668 n=1 Tax=Brevipalpus obovatus TaxID=246614 RepID=UPI003D9F68F1